MAIIKLIDGWRVTTTELLYILVCDTEFWYNKAELERGFMDIGNENKPILFSTQNDRNEFIKDNNLTQYIYTELEA